MANYPRASYMLFKTYNSEVVARVFFRGYFFGSVLLGGNLIVALARQASQNNLGSLSSYGIEAALGNSAHLFVSILLMYFLIKVFSQFRIISPAPTYHTRSHKPTDYPLKNQDDYRRNSYPKSPK